MLSQSEADYLLALPKVTKNGKIAIDLSKERNSVILISHQDTDWEFLIQITNSQKKKFKIKCKSYQFKYPKGIILMHHSAAALP